MKRMLLLTFVIFLASCSDQPSDTNAPSDTRKEKEKTSGLAEKRIKQYIVVRGMGMIKDIKIENVKKENDTTYVGTHTFFNSFSELDTRVTNRYFFPVGLDSVTRTESIKTEVKTEGEWVNLDI